MSERGDLVGNGRATVEEGPRVALVAATPAELAARARAASALLDDLPHAGLATTDGVYAGSRVRGRVSLLLPGQGAPVRAHSRTGTDTEVAQPVIHQASIAALRWIERLGVQPRAALGHSLGEFAALVWAGCVSGEDAEWLVRERGRLMQRHGATGTGMLSVVADEAGARALCDGTRLVVAAFNGPRSHVLAGPVREVRMAADRARAGGVDAVVLPVSHAFHSPAVAGCVPEFRACLRAATFHAPQRFLVSTVTGRPFTDADDPVELLSRQITGPVRFWEAVGRVAGETDLFCEAGPGRTLGALVAQGCDVAVTGVDTSGGDRALSEAAAALFAAGAAPDLASLFTGRAARLIDIWRDPVFLAGPCSSAPDTSHRESAVAVPEVESTVDTTGPAEAVRHLIATVTELDPDLITPELRLLGDLHLTSLRVVQLVAAAADTAGRGRPSTPVSVADATVADLIDVIEALPTASAAEADAAPQGVAAWLRCFTEVTRPVAPVANSTRERGSCRPHIVAGHPLSDVASATFGSGLGYPLLYVPDPAAPEVAAVVLAAARAAVEAGGLLAIAHDTALRGFLRSLRHEHPALGVTLLRVPATADELRAARRHAVVTPGEFRERVLAGDDVTEPVEQPLRLDLEDGPGLGTDDVLLVSGGKGIGYACAAALASATGVSLAVLGRSDPAVDASLRDNLRCLHDDGITVAYQRADVTDANAVAGAVRSLENRLGPVTGVLHAGGVNDPAALGQLDENRLRAHLAPKVTGLRNLLAAVATKRLRVLVTFGSVIGTWGLAGESHYALANGVMRAEVQRLRDALPRCRVLNVDWSVWTGTGMGKRLGVLDTLTRLDVAAIPMADGTEMFLRLLAARGLPSSVAVHGRLGGMERSAETEAGGGRFLERVRVHHREVELIADTTLDLGTDEYLTGHRIDGVVVLPAVLGLEAMAQAVSRLVGRPVLEAENVVLDRPIVVPDTGSRTIRVCTLRRGDVVDAVLRSDETGYRADHFRAAFPMTPRIESLPVEPIDVDEEPVLDGEDLYGPVYFHSGRFRRVRELVPDGARRCHARILAKDEDDWFDSEPLLGNPGVNDATVHALQACVPHRRLLPVRCDRVVFAPGTDAELHVHAVERHAAGGEYVWDSVAYDATGAPVITWRGLTLADAGALPGTQAWPLPLLAVHLERTVTTLGLDPGLRVSVRPERQEAISLPPGEGVSCGHAAGLVFAVDGGGGGGGGPACTARTVAERDRDEWQRLLGDLTTLVEELETRCPEPYDMRASRVWTAAECLSKAGRTSHGSLVLDGVYDGGWVVLREDASTVEHSGALVASAVVPVPGTDTPVAVAILSERAGEER